jgi:DNA-binding NarL/FixJ family response regulator
MKLGISVRVFLADAHPLFLTGVRTLLEGPPDLTIVGEATSGAQALRGIRETSPDVAVLDLSMPEMHGIALTDRLAADEAPTKVVIMSEREDPIYVSRAIAAGARGYVLKRSVGQDLLQGVRAVSGGGLYVDPAIADWVVSRPAEGDTRALTEREREVVRLIALGFTNKEVAGKLGISAKSVETYKMRASEKLEIRTRAKIVRYAMTQGWFDDLTLA